MEAMGIGIPCISTRISGILVNPESPEELADAMTTLLSGKELTDRLGNVSREKVLSSQDPERLADILTANLTRIFLQG